MEKVIKALALNLGCLVFGTIFLILLLTSMFSKNAVLPWVFLVILLIIIVIWVYGNVYLFRKPKQVVYENDELKSFKDFNRALEKLDPKCFKKQVRASLNQLERLEQRQSMLERILQTQFGNSEITKQKFSSAIANISGAFFDNEKRLINRIALFDYEDYQKLIDQNLEYTSAFEPYKESIIYINEKVDDNEKILRSLNDLTSELEKLNDSPKQIEDMSAMQEINDLIEHTKLYKH